MTREAGTFATTSWSLILAACVSDNGDSRGALAEFCRRYWSPVFAFVVAQGWRREEAEDLTQSFFETIIARKFLTQADRDRGRFRSFLLAALKNFLSNERDRQLAKKRGGGSLHVPLDVLTFEQAAGGIGPVPPDRLFDRQWALALLQRALQAVAAGDVAGGKLEHLLPFLTSEGDAPRYSDLAARLGVTEGSLRTAVHRLRARFRDQLRREIAETVLDPQDVDEEIRFLIATVST